MCNFRLNLQRDVLNSSSKPPFGVHSKGSDVNFLFYFLLFFSLNHSGTVWILGKIKLKGNNHNCLERIVFLFPFSWYSFRDPNREQEEEEKYKGRVYIMY